MSGKCDCLDQALVRQLSAADCADGPAQDRLVRRLRGANARAVRTAIEIRFQKRVDQPLHASIFALRGLGVARKGCRC